MTDQTLVQALVKAQSEVATPIKDKVNPQFKSKYASLGSIIDAVKGGAEHQRYCLCSEIYPP